MEVKDNETLDLRMLFIQYLLHWKLIIGVGFFSVIVAILYLVLYPKTYEATAQILLQDDRENLSSGNFGLGEAAGLMKSFGISSASGSSVVLDDELVILTSNQLVREMVTKLGIYVDYSEPYSLGYRLYGTEPLKVAVDSADLVNFTRTVKMDVSHRKDGSVHIKAKCKYSMFRTVKKSFDLPCLPNSFEFEGSKFNIDYASHYTDRNTAFELLVDVNSPIGVAESLVEDFLIEDYSKSSNILQMTCQDYEPQRAKDMFTTLIECYNAQAENYKESLSEKSLSFINDRINNTLIELEKIEASIESYKTKNQLTIVEYDVQMYAAAMQELQTKLIELEAQRHLIDLMEKFVRDPENKYKLVPTLYMPSTNGSEGASGSSLASYNQILVERERVIKNSSIENPMVASLTVQADRMRESVFKMIENARQSLDLTRADLKEKENLLLSKMKNIPQQERVYVDLTRQREIYQGVYLVLLQEREEIVMNVAQGKERARIVDAPYIKSVSVAPRKLYAAIGVILFTFVFSVGWLSIKYLLRSIISDLKIALKNKN